MGAEVWCPGLKSFIGIFLGNFELLYRGFIWKFRNEVSGIIMDVRYVNHGTESPI